MVKHILERMLEHTNATLAFSRWHDDKSNPSVLAYSDTGDVSPNITTCWRDIRSLVDTNNNQVCFFLKKKKIYIKIILKILILLFL